MDLDSRIDGVADKWKTERMTKVDLTIIRLATYEMLYDEEVPTGVAINEAVELAKTLWYGSVAGLCQCGSGKTGLKTAGHKTAQKSR